MIRLLAFGVALHLALAQTSGSSDGAAVVEALVYGFEMAPATRTSGLPPDAQRRLARYRQREASFTSTLTPPADLDGPLGSLYFKRVRMARAVFSLVDRPDARALAESLVENLEVLYEWEGFADSPLREAASADAFVAEHRASPVASYLRLFAGHRRLCATSGLEGLNPQSPEGQRVAAEAESQLAEARDAGDPVLRVAAEYLLRTRKCNEH